MNFKTKTMNLLFFHLEVSFGNDIKLIANNEIDLEQHLISVGYTSIEFSDLKTSYGTCSLKDQYGRQTAKCFYVTKI
jgi:hypothetical protein